MHLPRPSPGRRIRFNYLQTTRVLGKQASVGVRLIVLALRSDGAKTMSDPVEEQGTSDLVQLVVAGETSAFDVLLRRYNRDLVLRADTYIRRLRMYAPLYEGQEAVDDAVMAMCQRASRRAPIPSRFAGLLAGALCRVEARDSKDTRPLQRTGAHRTVERRHDPAET